LSGYCYQAETALFGSRAHGDSWPDSDIDIMVEFDPAAHVVVFNYAGLKDYIAGQFDGPVDVINRDGLEPYVRLSRRLPFLTPRPTPCATSRITSTSLPISQRASTTEAPHEKLHTDRDSRLGEDGDNPSTGT
jgi:predicted nucleotidyltransferase